MPRTKTILTLAAFAALTFTKPSYAANHTHELTLDAFLSETFRTNENSYFDQASNAFNITGTLFIRLSEFAVTEYSSITTLLHTGQWTAADGRHYDLRDASLLISRGNGGRRADVAAATIASFEPEAARAFFDRINTTIPFKPLDECERVMLSELLSRNTR